MLYMQSDSSSSYFTSCYWLLLYRVILCSRADSLRLHVILHEWIAFYSALFPYQSGVLTALAWLVPHETAAISTCSVYTIQPCTMSLHAKPHMWGTSRFGCNLSPVLLAEWMDLLHDTAVTQGWNGYRTKSQHRKFTLENKIHLPLLQGFKPVTFWSWVQHSSHWAISAQCHLVQRVSADQEW